MKTVGIITYHKYYNYGTMLQAYALAEKINRMGYSAEVIDFKQKNDFKGFQLIKLRLKRLPFYIKNFRDYKVLHDHKNDISLKNSEFDKFFNKNIPIGNIKYSETEELKQNPPQYDAYIVGSDQTWNPYVSNNPEAFYLNFINEGRKKGSYAPSIAVSKLSSEQKEKYKKNLSDFAFLSCREETGSKLLSEILGKPVTTVLDPTLLLDYKDWKEVSEFINIKKPYILTYFLGDNKIHRDYVKKLSEKTGYRIVTLPIAPQDMMEKSFEKIWTGPSGFLYLIKNAACLCTDSFHGTMFAVNFNTPFFSFYKTKDDSKESENSRIYNSLEKFSLSNRIVKDFTLDPNLEMSFDKANEILKNERIKSENYLLNMLKTITSEENYK